MQDNKKKIIMIGKRIVSVKCPDCKQMVDAKYFNLHICKGKSA